MWGQDYQVIGECVAHKIINIPTDYIKIMHTTSCMMQTRQIECPTLWKLAHWLASGCVGSMNLSPSQPQAIHIPQKVKRKT
jgi:hypothetical protein